MNAMRMPDANPPQRRRQDASGLGFTLIELMITLTVLAVVMIVLTTVMYTAARSKTSTANRIESSQAGRVAIDMLARDLRSAGFGADLDYIPNPQPPFAYIDSIQVLINANVSPYPDTQVVRLGPHAYNPAGAPRPFPLNGTAWTPPIKYRTGAEVIRWTLDANNDGNVTNDDRTTAGGLAALRTANPNDYVLVRQVFGDSTGQVAGNNGGGMESVALVRNASDADVPAMFTVYLKGVAIPWDWANGPIPANRLHDVERIEIHVVAPSAKPDWRGTYAETHLKTEVYSIRNVPNFGVKEFAVDGYVYRDDDQDNVKDLLEPGISGASVTLGNTYSTTTNAAGYFVFSAAAGTYTLRHTPPPGYGVHSSPDSFVVTIGPAQTRSFSDTLSAGGWVTGRTFEDTDADGVWDAGEPVISGVKLTVSPGGNIYYTDVTGTATMFANTGAYTVAVTAPDSFVVTTTNPFSGTMVTGGSASCQFGLSMSSPATITGNVFQDKNADGVKNGTDTGIQNVWVGVTSNGGSTVLSFTYTDASGNYSLGVPANSPPGTNPYKIQIIPSPGFFPTTSTEIGPVLVTAGSTLSGQNFGLNSFTRIVLTANRVLSLASGNLIEKDWNGNQTQNARGDADIVLGADAAGTDQISVWFNQYDNSTLFTSARTYARTAPNAVQAIAIDSLSEDAYPFSNRLDIVTGTKYAAAGNFFYWETQSSSGNEGYFPNSYTTAYKTADNGDVNAVVTGNVVGGPGIDIVVGTKSPATGYGTFEIWESSNLSSPTFTRQAAYPPGGGIPGAYLGEVNGLALCDFLGRGKSDLIVGTKTGTYTGQLMVFDGNAGGADVFKLEEAHDLPFGAVTCLAIGDVTRDGKKDIVLGIQTGFGGGELQLWENTSGGSLSFKLDTTVTTMAIPLCMVMGDLGGTAGTDLAVGYRADETSYVGGVLIYFLESGTLHGNGVDPSGGTIANMIPAMTLNNFNYGVKPALPAPPFFTDLAVGMKSGPSTGALIVFIR